MRLYRLPKFTSIDDLTLSEAPRPTPGRGQVLVKMHAASLNYRDLAIVVGRYGLAAVPQNVVPLSDGAGEVIEVGEGVTRVKSGDRVAGIFMQSWMGGEIQVTDRGSALGGAIDGVLAEYCVFNEQGLVHLPAHLSYEEGATLPCAAVTAWNALFTQQRLRPGQTVLVLGTGGVSVFGLQFAKAAGAQIIVTSSSDEKLERARTLGATHGINYKTHPEWEKEVRRLTDGRGVDHVIEVGGAGTLQRSLASARLGGTVYLIGVLSGVGQQIDPMPILGGGVTLRGIFVGSRDMFEAMNLAIGVHQLRPVIDRVFAFEQAREAYRHQFSGAHFGKVVIRIS
jgi:NADPH:quinone reductase-like Zn-dependent oxidoreductase